MAIVGGLVASFSFDKIISVDKELGGIYAIEHLDKPGFYYIGSAVNFYKRWRSHLSDFNLNKHHSIFLSRVYSKYGAERLVFSVLEIVKDNKNLIDREQFYINQCDFNKLYNTCPTAGNSLGTKHTKHSRLLISISKKGKKQTPRTEQARKNASLALKGRVFSEQHRANISKAKIGTKLNLSEEQRVTLSVRSKGRKNTPETIEKMKIAATGRRWSEEMKTKFSELAKGRRSKSTSLTSDQAMQIVKRSKEGAKRQDLAEEFKVSYYVIADLLIGRTYKYLNLVESK